MPISRVPASRTEGYNPVARETLDEIKQKVYFYFSVHRYEAAEKLIQTNLSSLGSVAVLHNLLGLTYHKQSKFLEALDEFIKAYRINLNYVEALLNAVVTLCDLGRYEEAFDYFNRLNSIATENSNLPYLIAGRIANKLVDVARIYASNGLNQDAIENYQRALAIFPTMPDMRIELAKVYLEEDDFEAAKNQLADLTKGQPIPNVEALNLMGLIAYKEGEKEMAMNYWRTATKHNPHNQTALAMLKIINRNLEDFLK